MQHITPKSPTGVQLGGGLLTVKTRAYDLYHFPTCHPGRYHIIEMFYSKIKVISQKDFILRFGFGLTLSSKPRQQNVFHSI